MGTDLSGKTALVTGSTSGIGRAIAESLALRGAHVIVSGRDAVRGEVAAEQIRAAGGKADFVAAVLREAADARALATKALALTGRIDILVNNAGIYSFGPTADVSEAAWDEMYDTNVKVPFFLVAELAPKMAAAGGGTIVNISTALANKGVAGGALYASTKAATTSLTRSWSAEYGPAGVRINTVSPGPIYTPGTAALGEGAIDTFAVGAPAERVGRPDEIAAAVAFLVSDDASYIHAADLAVDGGKSAV